LWWTAVSAATYTNIFGNATDGVRPTGGNAIGFCNTLNTTPSGGFAGRTNWYLPTMKEIFQAYIDGIYSQDTTFGTINSFASSTEGSGDNTRAWGGKFNYGDVGYYLKTETGLNVRCVSR
jgi:hypothetical protein